MIRIYGFTRIQRPDCSRLSESTLKPRIGPQGDQWDQDTDPARTSLGLKEWYLLWLGHIRPCGCLFPGSTRARWHLARRRQLGCCPGFHFLSLLRMAGGHQCCLWTETRCRCKCLGSQSCSHHRCGSAGLPRPNRSPHSWGHKQLGLLGPGRFP